MVREDDFAAVRVSRRSLAAGALALLPGVRRVASLSEISMQDQEKRGGPVTLTSIEGLQVGHRTRDDRPTGCTVILAGAGATAGVAVRGAAPGSRELALLSPENTVQQVHAVLLTGGSAYGLAAADGVMRVLRERGIGYRVGRRVVPIVPGAVLYDLGLGDSFPDADDGAAATRAASSDAVAEGSVGAGAGATVGKLMGGGPMKGGVGSAGFRFADGMVVAALVAVNCVGDVRDPHDGSIVAGARAADGRTFIDVEKALLAGAAAGGGAASGANTTIGLVATNRALTKVQCSRLASVAHDGLARAIVPAHTRFDGDTLFALSTASAGPLAEEDHTRLEVAAAAAVAESIVRAVRLAAGLPGVPGVRELGAV